MISLFLPFLLLSPPSRRSPRKLTFPFSTRSVIFFSRCAAFVTLFPCVIGQLVSLDARLP